MLSLSDDACDFLYTCRAHTGAGVDYVSIPYLSEQEPGRAFTHDPFPGYVVKEVNVFLRSLHDYVEAVAILKVV